MHIIEKIYSVLIALILIGGCIFIYRGGINFVKHQDVDSYFSNDEVYTYVDDTLLVKSRLICGGETYEVGETISKTEYNKCKGGNWYAEKKNKPIKTWLKLH